MNLIDKQVTHKHFGRGTVVEHTDSYIEIHFKSGNKRFVFPDAFGTYLSLADKEVATSIKKIKQEREKERLEKERELEKKRMQLLEEQERKIEREKLLKSTRVHPVSQCAFWCDINDLDEIFTQWKVFTGLIKSGSRKGMPNRPIRMNQNSACLLTVREAGMPEKSRYIVGAFMVGETFVGRLCNDGYIPAHSEFRLRLSDEEARKMLFWDYYVNEKNPQKKTWSTGKYRYFDNELMAKILKDIVALKSETDEYELAQQFFEHFCQANRIEEEV